MKIFINWENIDSEEEFYRSFLPQIHAPDWHGHNLDALNDSVVNGDIGCIEPPYCIINLGTEKINPSMKSFFEKVQGVFRDAKEQGRRVRVFDE